MSHPTNLFPPPPRAIKGRTKELQTLSTRLTQGDPARIALVGGGGSGKSFLACALGHRVKRHFPGGIHWLRVGAWDSATLLEMLARRLGTTGTKLSALTQILRLRGPAFIVLDNHENDASLARFLDALRNCPITWVITARRCLLSGVEVFPVVAPLVTSRQIAFPKVAQLTKILRWNPLALDIADALVSSRAITTLELKNWLQREGVDRITVMAHEDDVAEVRLLVAWAWAKLSADSRRLLAVLAYSEGDDVDEDSLYRLARCNAKNVGLKALLAWRLVQEPLKTRYTLHAVVRYAIQKRTSFPSHRYFDHYVPLMERNPSRVRLEQSHLFAAMDYAHQTSNLDAALRVERLLTVLENAAL